MIVTRTTFIGLFLVAITSVFAQQDNMDVIRQEVDSLEYKPWQIKRLGKKADQAKDVYTAIDYYSIYIELKPDKKRYQYLLAELYREARDYEKALEFYTKIYEEVPEQFPMALYWSGIMTIMSKGDYEEAKNLLEDFKKKHKPALNQDKELKKLFKYQLEGIEMADTLINYPLEVVITHLDTSINKAHQEFSPIFYNDTTLIFGSLRQDGIQYYAATDTTSVPTRKFYVASKQFDDWRYLKELDGPYNSNRDNVGNGTFSLDKKRFYFTRCEPVDGENVCSIYSSAKDSLGNWSTPNKMGFGINDPLFTSSHPTVGIEPKTGAEALYFATNRPGGKGGMDIWYTYYREKKDEWKSPKKCGSKINSIGDEITPFYDMETKTLYFSSSSWPGLGGFDIFKSQGQLNKWTEPKNVGSPINGKTDDIDFTISPNEEEGFFVSNRSGGVALKNETCCDDIYHFKFTKYIKIFVTGNLYQFEEEEESDFKVLDSINQLTQDTTLFSDSTGVDTEVVDKHATKSDSLALPEADIKLMLLSDDGSDKIEIKSAKSNEQGSYLMKLEQGNNYQLIFSKEGYFKHHVDISTKEITKPDTIVVDAMWLQKIPNEPIVVKNIYYPFDKSYLTDSSKTVIDTTLYSILIENPEIIIEVSSHTDSKGSDAYNERLSQARAESVVKYLISKGIERERLQAKGYGETQPIAPNENEDGSDNPVGRQKNRRTEFRIVGVIEGKTGVVYEE